MRVALQGLPAACIPWRGPEQRQQPAPTDRPGRCACRPSPPETAQGPAGAEATATLRQLLEARPLELRPQTTDRYGRTVAEVIAGGRNVNLEMVRTGAAFVFYQYLRDCDQAAYIAAEQQAQRFRQGVWRWDGGTERPWDFRSRRRNP